ncbi:PREDICTED: serine--tRNA ligase, chloroplastic/mitochondrial-like isoform X2 [Camelina sativa]|nr:PREDICTED: serine--tRNA ligase, chloroplastic/mitochondrial-like isoform X2 [Camelina sativa]XP_010458455.1 PREDICTED: serine--tRNA ligase, chloroplastic/mitochondrial-like isoform X2 [Camelina sativa]
MRLHKLRLAAAVPVTISTFSSRLFLNPFPNNLTLGLFSRRLQPRKPLLVRAFSASAAVQDIPATQPQWKASIDFKWIRDNKEAVEINIKNRNSNANLDAVLELYENMLNLQKEVERLREERNNVAKKMKGKLEPSERDRLVEEGKNLKESLVTLEEDLVKLKDGQDKS